MNKQLVKVAAIKCLLCGDTIYSRANHDFKWCSCKNCYVDGGPSIISDDDDNDGGNMRVGWTIKSKIIDVVEIIELSKEVSAKKVLINDWNRDINDYGLVKDNKYTEDDLIAARAKIKLLEG